MSPSSSTISIFVDSAPMGSPFESAVRRLSVQRKWFVEAFFSRTAIAPPGAEACREMHGLAPDDAHLRPNTRSCSVLRLAANVYSFPAMVIPVMKATSECTACELFESRYEAATFDLARIHNALDIAEHLRDRDSIRKLTLEAFAISDRKRAARASYVRHRKDCHPELGPVLSGPVLDDDPVPGALPGIQRESHPRAD